MSIQAVHCATQQVFRLLPQDLHPLLTEFVGATRDDWRTCKRFESNQVLEYYAIRCRKGLEDLTVLLEGIHQANQRTRPRRRRLGN
jgi:hypothetical protein